MADPLQIDLFAEDRGHEELLRPLLVRLAQEEKKSIEVCVRSARGGHGRAIAELALYQRTMLKRPGREPFPNLLVAAIDANCKSYTAARKELTDALLEPFAPITVCACPDPHVERWYLADQDAFQEVVGLRPDVPAGKCERDLYKQILAQAVVEAGHPATLGGIEFARELAKAMNYFRAGKVDTSLKHFLEEVRNRLRTS